MLTRYSKIANTRLYYGYVTRSSKYGHVKFIGKVYICDLNKIYILGQKCSNRLFKKKYAFMYIKILK